MTITAAAAAVGITHSVPLLMSATAASKKNGCYLGGTM
jgi:hypothetical protein